MKICFFMERGSPPRLNPVMADVFNRLETNGVKVIARYPEEELVRLDAVTIEADLYCLKSDSEMALSLATVLEGMGARIMNPVSGTLRAKDKLLAAATLQHAGIPTPRSMVAARPDQLGAELLAGPLILKPPRGYHGAGIEIATDADALPDKAAYPDFVFAQTYLANARKDLKIFVIGEKVFGVRKKFAADSFLNTGVPDCLSEELEALARRCGQAFGLELYGVDVVEDQGGFYVVDVNYFPGYRGVPEASWRLADHIMRAARG